MRGAIGLDAIRNTFDVTLSIECLEYGGGLWRARRSGDSAGVIRKIQIRGQSQDLNELDAIITIVFLFRTTI